MADVERDCTPRTAPPWHGAVIDADADADTDTDTDDTPWIV